MPSYDARAVANFLLDLAEQDGKEVSNLVLQKLVYFAHGRHLHVTGQPLVNGEFEAWEYGPVHTHVYHAFKEHGKRPIDTRAVAVNPVTQEQRAIPPVADAFARDVIKSIYDALKSRSPTSLVALSHAKNAPWDVVVGRAKKRESISMRISNDVIRERFRFHAINVLTEQDAKAPDENNPFA